MLLLAVAFGLPAAAPAQDPKTPYSNMAPLAQYLMTDQNVEIVLARSAAPVSISRDAAVMVLKQHGYETVDKGKNGFVCLVDRSWMSPFDSPEFWNPKNRSPTCFNPAAVRSVLPFELRRTELVLAGLSKTRIVARIRAAIVLQGTAGTGARRDVLHDVPESISRRCGGPLSSASYVL